MTENELVLQIRWLRDSMDAALSRYQNTEDHTMSTFWYAIYKGFEKNHHNLCEKLHSIEQNKGKRNEEPV